MTREESFALAFAEQKSALDKKRAEYRAKIDALSAENPQFEQINRSLAALGAKTAITALSGNTAALEKLQQQIAELSAERKQLLENAGIGDVVYDCKACEDTGYINGKICDCIKSRAKAALIASLSKNLPLEYCGFENFDLKYYPNKELDGANSLKRMTQIFKMCKEYAIGFNPASSESMLFMGNTGLGKTHLSLSIVKELLNRGFNVIYGSAYNLFAEMESEHFGEHTNHKYEAAIACDLLVIDDLGSEFVSPYIQTLLYNIINTRLLAHKPTIINTNLTMGEIADKYTPRVSSRLMGEYRSKLFLGGDIRQIKAIEKR